MNSLNKPRHIFLVDDDDDDRELFSSAVSVINHPVVLTEFISGLELIKSLSNPSAPSPEIIFLDLNMPTFDGFDCLKAIKSLNTFGKDFKVVILTTSPNPKHRQNALELGANNYFVKPTAFKELVNIVNQALDENCGISLRVQKGQS